MANTITKKLWEHCLEIDTNELPLHRRYSANSYSDNDSVIEFSFTVDEVEVK